VPEAERLPEPTVRNGCLVRVVGALARAGRAEHAVDVALGVSPAHDRAEALVVAVRGLVSGGHVGSARAVAGDAAAHARALAHRPDGGADPATPVLLSQVVAALASAGADVLATDDDLRADVLRLAAEAQAL